jgi:glycosyltransferase involved in cell wall biosynthesis
MAIRQLLRAQGHYCGVVNLTRYRSTEGDDVYYPESALQTVALLFRLRYDIAHFQFGGNVSLRLLMLWLVCSLIPGKKTVLTFHSGGYPSSEAGRSARPATLRGFVFRRIDRIICVNEEMVAMFQRFGVRENRLRLILPHAVIQYAGVELRPEIAAFFQSHSPVLASVGGLEPEYDVPLQVEAIGALVSQFPGLGLIVIGSGSLEQQIRETIRSRPFAGHILLCGDVPHAETLRVIQECRILLRTTLYDGDSIAIREALHYGTPVIATDNGMRPAGLHLFAISDREGCRRAIEQILTGPEQADRQPQEQMGDNNVLAVLQLYRELISS